MDIRSALLVDIVRSRDLPDRANAQTLVRESFAKAEEIVPPVRPLWATAGDEFQAVLANTADAVAVTTLVRVLLPEGIDCRFGIGEGEIHDIDAAAEDRPIQDGSAWWNARTAIDRVHGMQQHGHPDLRTWSVGQDEAAAAAVNAFLAARDHILTRMKPRERRLAAAYFRGRAQDEIARDEKISQSAVSQALGRSGARAVRLGIDLLRVGGLGHDGGMSPLSARPSDDA